MNEEEEREGERRETSVSSLVTESGSLGWILGMGIFEEFSR